MTSSKPVSKEHFLNASLELQLDFVKMWCESHRTSIEKQLEDAHCIRMIYFDLNEQVGGIDAEIVCILNSFNALPACMISFCLCWEGT